VRVCVDHMNLHSHSFSNLCLWQDTHNNAAACPFSLLSTLHMYELQLINDYHVNVPVNQLEV